MAAEVCMSRVRVDWSWCLRLGHQVSSCWRKGGSFLICGGQHQIRNCSRYVAPIPLGKPIYLFFMWWRPPWEGSREVKWLSIFCQWCEWQGQSEEEACPVNNGACLICGSSSCVLSSCHEFVSRSDLLIFHSWFTECGSHHVGAQRNSPHFE